MSTFAFDKPSCEEYFKAESFVLANILGKYKVSCDGVPSLDVWAELFKI